MTTSSLPSLDTLVSPFGVVAACWASAEYRGLDRLNAGRATAGARRGARGKGELTLTGDGRIVGSPEHARLVAIAEAAERYASGDFLGEPRRWATADELDGAVLDPARYPRCSAAEYAAPGCPVAPFLPEERIRWVRGLELTSGDPIWLPAVMACYGLRNPAPAERFTYRISTGYAVHTDPVEALVAAICEVIERDAIALTWLQRLPLPLAGPAARSEAVGYLTGWAERHFVETSLFDATTDLGVPTVYCLLTAPYDDRARHAVGCATARTMALAAEKALTEALATREACHADIPVPEDYAQFAATTDGTRYMGAALRSAAFEFFRDGRAGRASPTRPALPESPDAALARLTAIFAERGMPVAVVDRTPRELGEVGLTCVSVVVPDLQPMSLLPLAQFRAHPRLYDAPARMGYPVSDEQELNPWPQPFP
jgi:ribosomal protein S12 methylthiotransferase accessory factor